MRLLLRANAHRPVDGGVEVAASPDTPTRPEPWSWHVRLLADATCAEGAARSVRLRAGGRWEAVAVDVDPEVVTPELSLVDLAGTTQVDRDEDDLVALVVATGSVLVEGRHALLPGDAMVLTGDDPLTVSATGSDGTLALVRLSSVREPSVGWVP